MTAKIIENGVERLATEEEIQSLNEIRASFEQKQQLLQADFIRQERNRILISCDWIITKAVEQNAQDNLGIQVPQVWLDYRQALRDIPQQDGFPLNVIWPDEP